MFEPSTTTVRVGIVKVGTVPYGCAYQASPMEVSHSLAAHRAFK